MTVDGFYLRHTPRSSEPAATSQGNRNRPYWNGVIDLKAQYLGRANTSIFASFIKYLLQITALQEDINHHGNSRT
jgi:hypothetical protein